MAAAPVSSAIPNAIDGTPDNWKADAAPADTDAVRACVNEDRGSAIAGYPPDDHAKIRQSQACPVRSPGEGIATGLYRTLGRGPDREKTSAAITA